MIKHYPRIMTLLALPFIACGCHDKKTLSLDYNAPAQFFEEALVIGNGTLGATVYGGVEEDKIALNDITLWSGEPVGEPFAKDAWKDLAEVRACLDAENYPAAEIADRKIQGYNGQYYQPLGHLRIHTGPTDFNGYKRSLNISDALASVSYNTSSGSVRREYFASAPDSVIVIRLTSADGKKFNNAITYSCPQEALIEIIEDGGSAEFSVMGYTAYNFNHNSHENDPDFYLYDPDRGIHFRTIIKVVSPDGSVSGEGTEILLRNCSEATIYITNVTSFNGSDKDPVKEGREYVLAAQSRIDKASAKPYDKLLSDHISDYRNLFDRLSLDLGETDPEIAGLPTDIQLKLYGDLEQRNPDLEELYFQFGRYLLISCSRTAEVPANLQGLWNEYMTAPWRSNYTMNINLEENYWPSETGNLSELHFSLLNFIKKLSISGKNTASNYYGVNTGWCSGHNSDIWAPTEPVGEHNGCPQWSGWPMGAAWLTTHIWEHYSFSMDKEFLAEYYPVLRDAALFCINWLIEKDGYLMTSPSTSPEANYRTPEGFEGGTLYGGSADIAFTRECLIDAKAAAQVLGQDEDFIKLIDETMPRLLPYKIGSRGNLQEWYFDWEDADWKHRHQSHLFGLFPGHHITVESTPELAEACARTLEIKGDKSTGWSTGWRVNLQARLKDSEKAYHIYRMLLTYISPDGYQGDDARRGGGTYPNLLDAHSPFQIDGNFGGCAGVMEMLVQSSLEDGAVLLPALPEAWKAKGSLNGVRIRGGFELSFSWQDGMITRLSAKSVRPDRATVKIKCGDSSWSAELAPGSTKKLK